jgi:hypothetical protein
MTGGTVVVLGSTGRNFAAGMSGGIAYVYDPDGQFERRCNLSMVSLEPVQSGAAQEAAGNRDIWHTAGSGRAPEPDEAILRRLIESHFRYTGSFQAREILASWATARGKFVKVFPLEYRRAAISALSEIAARQAAAAEAAAAAPAPAVATVGADGGSAAPSLPGDDHKVATEKTVAGSPAAKVDKLGKGSIEKSGERGGAASKVPAGRQR